MNPENLAKQSIPGQIKEKQNYDKSIYSSATAISAEALWQKAL